MVGKLRFSLFMMAVIAGGLVGSQSASAGHFLAARGGKSSASADAGCWFENGASVTNTCGAPKWWYVPLADTGTTWVTVTAQGANNSSNVTCGATGWDKWGNWYFGSGWLNLSQFGPAVDIVMPVYVPSYGTANVDCLVYPNGKVITVGW